MTKILKWTQQMHRLFMITIFFLFFDESYGKRELLHFQDDEHKISLKKLLRIKQKSKENYETQKVTTIVFKERGLQGPISLVINTIIANKRLKLKIKIKKAFSPTSCVHIYTSRFITAKKKKRHYFIGSGRQMKLTQ